METISSQDFYAFCKRSDLTLLKTTYDRPKLFESKNGEIIKIFYPRKKLLSSNRYKPYALRFCTNAEELKTRGVITPEIRSVKYCQDLNVYIITYQKLPGIDARVFSSENINIIPNIAAFIAELHQKGIFFRSIHLENLLCLTDNQLALLDIVDMQFKNRAISLYLRFRNLKHLFKIKEDQAFWANYGIAQFLKIYFQHAKISFIKRKLLTFLLT